tara:strand:+ start:1793 stop:2167 length:375 start_codon:yes stop_codon:yes gene_type:complete
MGTKKSVNTVLGFIDRDILIEGSVHSQKKVVVSGTVSGSVSGDQEIVVSETGNVHGKVEGKKIIIAGKVDGKLLAHDQLEVISSANIKGEMKAPSGKILIKQGANLDARCKVLLQDKSKKQLTS